MTTHTELPDKEFEQFLRDKICSLQEEAGFENAYNDAYCARLIEGIIKAHSASISRAVEEERKTILKFVPTDQQVASVCLSIDHAFGLQDEKTKEWQMHEAKEYLRAWQKEIQSIPSPTPRG